MNEKILETLEFQRIKDQLAKYLASATGKQELAERYFSGRKKRWMEQTFCA